MPTSSTSTHREEVTHSPTCRPWVRWLALPLILASCATDSPRPPADVDAALEAGRIHLYRGETADAHIAFRELTRSDPGLLGAWEGAVDSLPDDDDLKDGLRRELDAHIASVQGDPNSVALQTLRARLNANLVDRERELYALLEKGGPYAGWPRAALADVFQERGNPTAAFDAFKQATQETPGLARAWRGLAQSILDGGTVTDAIDVYEHYLGMRPNDPDALYNLAYVLTQVQQRPRDARPYLERAVNVCPDDTDMLINLGTTSLLLEEPDVQSAEQNFKRALALNPSDADVHYNLGVLYADHTKDARRAIHHFERYLDLGGPEVRRIRAWIQELGGKGS